MTEMTNDKKRDMEAPRMSEEAARKQEMRKKRKLEKAEAMKTGEWDRCMFKIVRKNRFCSNGRIAGSEFCGNHVPSDGSACSKTAQNYKEELRVRVPCPLDGAHTVYAYDLEKHVKVCNKMRQAATMQSLPYYTENINSGSHADVEVEAAPQPAQTENAVANEETETPVDTSSEQQQPQEHSGPSTLQEQSLIDRLAALDFADLTARIHAAFDRCVGEIPLQKRHHACCDALLAEKTAAKSSKNVLRHIEQQASILGNMDEVHLLDDASTAFLELGAGRGMLSLAMAQALPSNLYVLIDRAGGRGKADHFIREMGNSGRPQPRVIRAKIDIRHLNLAGFEELTDLPIVGMSKHLCGVATDLSLRSLHTLPKPKKMKGDNTLSPVFKGIAVALCCHHACSWDDYVSPDFFLSQGFTAQEFALVASMTSWATCAMALTGDSVEYVLGISQADRAVLGRKCKRILDAGRVDYLKKLGLQAKLVHYCDVEESVENCLLLAYDGNLQ